MSRRGSKLAVEEAERVYDCLSITHGPACTDNVATTNKRWNKSDKTRLFIARSKAAIVVMAQRERQDVAHRNSGAHGLVFRSRHFLDHQVVKFNETIKKCHKEIAVFQLFPRGHWHKRYRHTRAGQ